MERLANQPANHSLPLERMPSTPDSQQPTAKNSERKRVGSWKLGVGSWKLVSIVIRFAFLRLSLQQEGAIDDDHLVGTKPGQDLDLAGEITSAADAPNLEVTRILGQEHAPLVANALDCRDWHGQDRGCPMLQPATPRWPTCLAAGDSRRS